MKKKITVLLILTMVVAAAPRAHAEGTAGDYFADLGKQLGRGLINVVTSPAEIPCTMASDIKDKGAATGTFTGFGKGLAFMLRRILIGVSEIGTFMLPRSEPSIAPVCQANKNE